VVVGVPDAKWGEKVSAVIQAREGKAPTLEELDRHCRTRVAAYKVPRLVAIVDQMVRSPAGKADYQWARSVAAQSSQQGASSLPSKELPGAFARVPKNQERGPQ
jgi:3-oxocholest-4-en-26-oate---CoA ligase